MTLDLFGGVSIADTGDRSALDFYPTPAFMTRSLLHFHPAIRRATVIEPCSGDGAIVRVLEAAGCTVWTNDLDRRHAADEAMDATEAAYWTLCAPPVDWVITNPPFNVALPILQHAVRHARVGAAFLLRKTFLEPTEERGPWLMAHPPSRIIGEPRYSFRGKGSDSVPCDWMIWLRERVPGLRPIEIDYHAETRTGDPS